MLWTIYYLQLTIPIDAHWVQFCYGEYNKINLVHTSIVQKPHQQVWYLILKLDTNAPAAIFGWHQGSSNAKSESENIFGTSIDNFHLW